MKKILLALYLATLAFLSLNPWLRPSGGDAFGEIAWDKVDHAMAYGGLTVLLIAALGKTLRGYWLPLAAILVSAALGAFMEYCQAWFTETRQFSVVDAYANGVGAIFGALEFGLFQFVWRIIRPSCAEARP